MLHLTVAEQTVIRSKLYEIVKEIVGDISCDYIIDIRFKAPCDSHAILSIDCNKIEAKVQINGKEFDITKRSNQPSLVAKDNSITTEEYDTLKALEEVGIDKLCEYFEHELTEREKIHADIVGTDNSSVKSETKSYSRAAKQKEVDKDKIIKTKFNNEFETVRKNLGFTGKSTQVKLDEVGDMTLKKIDDKYTIVLEEVVTNFKNGQKHTHRLEYDTLLKHPSYAVDGKLLPVDDIIASLHCSVDFKKAVDAILSTLDAMIEGGDKLIDEAKLQGLNLESSNDKFLNFKKSHIE